MFKRIIYEEWVMFVVIAWCAAVVCIFLLSTIRAFFLPKEKRDRLANLPLDDDKSSPHPPQDPTSTPPKP